MSKVQFYALQNVNTGLYLGIGVEHSDHMESRVVFEKNYVERHDAMPWITTNKDLAQQVLTDEYHDYSDISRPELTSEIDVNDYKVVEFN